MEEAMWYLFVCIFLYDNYEVIFYQSKDLYSCQRLRTSSVWQKLMAFRVSFCHKELLLSVARILDPLLMAVNGKQKFIRRKQPSNLIQQLFIQAVLCGYNYKIVKSYIFQQKRISMSQMDLFQMDINSFALILRKNALYCVLVLFRNPTLLCYFPKVNFLFG